MVNNDKLLDGKYKVIKLLGQGGMGTVYLCENIRINKLWAIKEISNSNGDKFDLLSEPNILKNLSHAGIPKIIDVFYEDNNLYIVEDYIEGKTLKEYVKEGNITGEEEICKIMLEICSIISYLHNLNPPIIYRDLKPSNIMITKDKRVVLVDFGIAKQYKFDSSEDTRKLGSNGYAAPEQYGSGKCSVKTDIYGAGMVLYFMTSGKNPSTPIEPLIDGNYNEGVNNEIKRIIMKCVQIEFKDRYESINDLRGAISKVIEQDNYEKTMILASVKENDIKKIAVKKRRTPKLKKYFAGFLLLVIIALGITYFLNNYNKNDEAVLDQPTASDATANDTTAPALQTDNGTQNTSNEQPTVEKSNDQSNNNNQNDNNYSTNSKGKGKGLEKKKFRPKH